METEPFVHPTAEIETGALLEPGVRVWHLCHVREGARIGAGTSLGRNVFIDAGVRIGGGCKVQNNVSVYAGVELGDAVFVGPAVCFTNDRYPRADSPDWEVVPTRVDHHASLGGGSTVVCGVTIGHHALVAAGAVVTRDVEPYAVVAGVPARRVGWACRCGRPAPGPGADCPNHPDDGGPR